MSIARFETLQNAAGSKSVPVATVVDGSAKAWVNFNGTGTVAIRAAFNVTSVSDNGVGDYTVNFTNAMADANYAATVTSSTDATSTGGGVINTSSNAAPSTTAYRFLTGNSAGALSDSNRIQVAIFR